MNSEIAYIKRQARLKVERSMFNRLKGVVRPVIGQPIRTLKANTIGVFQQPITGMFGYAGFDKPSNRWNIPRSFHFRTVEAAATAALDLRFCTR